ncbi:hypothetical protein [Nocardia cyriacigeorgica]|uniref:hypothetical protein n=1 Tax=Nocardia cyriacigeorgica TaxID=135487 RepID=UPI002453A7AC|nr:hypothetical protein [Nocardia cyriacigeorgica]
MSLLAELEHAARVTELQDQIEAKDSYIASLEAQIAELKAKSDNRKKLSPRDVQLIRRFGNTTGMPHREIADAFEVNRATVSRILNGTYHKGN